MACNCGHAIEEHKDESGECEAKDCICVAFEDDGEDDLDDDEDYDEDGDADDDDEL